ncbi:MAG: hypothetical protein IH944_05895 [Armatimonadetes bacterium]|nr:hypothetical protein [Armatimonadota bacterium]
MIQIDVSTLSCHLPAFRAKQVDMWIPLDLADTEYELSTGKHVRGILARHDKAIAEVQVESDR